MMNTSFNTHPRVDFNDNSDAKLDLIYYSDKFHQNPGILKNRFIYFKYSGLRHYKLISGLSEKDFSSLSVLTLSIIL